MCSAKRRINSIADKPFLFNTHLSVILAGKLNSLIINTYDAMIANGNLMCLSSQVFNHLVRTTERTFGMHYPGGNKRLVEKIRCLLR